MPDAVKPTPLTDYPRRRRRAEATRGRVLDAARDLFLERGYIGTTIEAIATRADVAPETVYATFGNKRALLSTVVDVSIAGEADPRPILEQAWVQEMRVEPDRHRRAAILGRQGTAMLERRHGIDEVIRGAAGSDPEIAALRDLGKAQRRAGQLELLRLVIGDASLRPGLDLDTAADIVYAIGSPETYRLLVVDRGWSAARFEAWYSAGIEALLGGPRA